MPSTSSGASSTSRWWTLQPGRSGTRYRLLETLREYGRARLAEAGETDLARDAHLAHFLAEAEAVHEEWNRRGSGTRMVELERDYDDLRAALDWSRRADPAAGLRLAGAMREVWYRRGQHEGRAWLVELLRRGHEPGPDRARALLAAGYLAIGSQAHEEASRLLEQSRALSAELGDLYGEAAALHLLGASEILTGDAEARQHLERATELFELLGDRHGMSTSLIRLGHLAVREGRADDARWMLNRGLELAEAVDDGWARGAANLFLALLAGREASSRRPAPGCACPWKRSSRWAMS